MIFVSSKSLDGNMSLLHGDFKKALENRQSFFKNLRIDTKNIAEVTQVHGNKVLRVNKVPNRKLEADGLITNNQNLYLMIKIADCMAIGFIDSIHNAFGLIHAGKKGLEKEIIRKTIEGMIENFGTDPADLIIKISPSIGPCCYDLDIWQGAEKQLEENGVLQKNINNPKICTYESKEYFSHREAANKQSPDDFRFVTILGVKNVN